MAGFAAPTSHYKIDSTRCTGWRQIVIPLAEIEPILRSSGHFDFKGMSRDRMVAILTGISAGSALPPIYVNKATGPYLFRLYDGFHRYHASVAAGFSMIPAFEPELQISN